ncbi:TorF family putative porin [Porticoccus sp. W117]|uniref:TorF family putative porin n=1 Tax=Porticoccus sp. W117 TaxID=3054777 RepID=UPI002598A3CE|nr:TorF family putative porin [Porticoccus sp. W117]MDM3870053.1 TorF family putative porin [Porticoccus sp. W117]
MRNVTFKSLLAALILPASMAQAEDVISANVSLTTDYIFRGQSQTGEHGAIQGGFDYSADSGFYAGAWASTVDFGSSAQAEVDFYGGYAGSFSESVDYDIGYIYYSYTGESALDYQELTFSVSLSNLSLGLVYSDEYLGEGGESFVYLSSGYSISLPQEYALDLHLGFNSADDMDITFDGTGDDSYIDWSAVVTKNFGGADFSLGYYGTDIGSGNELADDRLVFAISKSL